MRSSRWASSTIAICVARALRQVATCVTRPTSATAMNVAAKRRVMLGVARMGLHNMRATCTFQAVRPHTLGLIGLGAIGGSIARQVKQPGNGAAGGIAVVGWSPEPAERALAAQQGALDDAPPRAADVARVADILVLAAPPAANLAQHAPPGSTFGAGAADTTRLAASEPALWTEILLMNRDELLPALRALEEPLGELQRALEVGDAAAVTAWLGR